MALHFVAFGPRIDYEQDAVFDLATVSRFMASMAGSPAIRAIKAVERMDGDQDRLHLALSSYDSILARLSDPEIRKELDRLDYGDRHHHRLYQEIRLRCRELHSELADLVLSLPDLPKREMLEMFLL